MTMRTASALLAILFLVVTSLVAQSHSATVTVKNPIDLNRTSETIVLNASELRRDLGVEDVRKVHVRDDAGKEVLTQAVDNNDDGTFDDFVFQTDFGPNATKTFTLV